MLNSSEGWGIIHRPVDDSGYGLIVEVVRDEILSVSRLFKRAFHSRRSPQANSLQRNQVVRYYLRWGRYEEEEAVQVEPLEHVPSNVRHYAELGVYYPITARPAYSFAALSGDITLHPAQVVSSSTRELETTHGAKIFWLVSEPASTRVLVALPVDTLEADELVQLLDLAPPDRFTGSPNWSSYLVNALLGQAQPTQKEHIATTWVEQQGLNLSPLKVQSLLQPPWSSIADLPVKVRERVNEQLQATYGQSWKAMDLSDVTTTEIAFYAALVPEKAWEKELLSSPSHHTSKWRSIAAALESQAHPYGELLKKLLQKREQLEQRGQANLPAPSHTTPSRQEMWTTPGTQHSEVPPVSVSSAIPHVQTHNTERQIRAFVQLRGIQRVLHLTRIENLPGIIEAQGILSRQSLDGWDTARRFKRFDMDRLDGRRAHVNCSISYYNMQMFYGLVHKERIPIALCVIKPDCLWHPDTLFSPINAATNAGARVRSGLAGLQSLFAERVIDKKGAQTREMKPSELPTCIQAEVLVYDRVPLNDIMEILVQDSLGKQKVRAAGWDGLILVSPQDFEYRSKWYNRSENIFHEELEGGFDFAEQFVLA